MPGVGEAKAASIFALAEEWVVDHPVVARFAPVEPAIEEGDPAAGDASAAGEPPAVDAVNAPVPDDSTPSGTG